MVRNNNKKKDAIELGVILLALLVVNIIGSIYFFRIDLTEDKKFSLGEPTKNLLDKLDEDVEVTIYLSGDLPNRYKKIENAIADKLKDIGEYSGVDIYYEFIDPIHEVNDSTKKSYADYLQKLGVIPVVNLEKEKGSQQRQAIFPVGIITYKGRRTIINFFERAIDISSTNAVAYYISQIEYEIANSLKLLEQPYRKKIAFTQGHGEPDDKQHFDLFKELRKFSDVDTINLSMIPSLNHESLEHLELLVIVKPSLPFSESDKYKIDQYIMNGGNVAFFIDPIDLRPDTTGRDRIIGVPRDLNLNDLLFTYGARVNNTMIQDFRSSKIKVQVDDKGTQKAMKYDFFPIVSTKYGDRIVNHISVKNAGAVLARDASTLDSIKADGIKKTPLLFTSESSRISGGNIFYEIDQLSFGKTKEYYPDQNLPIALLLEGKFKSSFQFKPVPKSLKGQVPKKLLNAEKESKLLVCSDGDLLLGFTDPKTKRIFPLGFNPHVPQNEPGMFANKNLFLSIFDYQMDATGINALKAKEIKPRPIATFDDQKFWQYLNVAAPLVILLVIWFVIFFIRKTKNTGYSIEE